MTLTLDLDKIKASQRAEYLTKTDSGRLPYLAH